MASHLTQNIIQTPPHNFQGPAVLTFWGAAHLWSFSPSLKASSMFLRHAGPLSGLFPQPDMPFPRDLHDQLPQHCQVLTKKSHFHQKSSSWSVVARPLFLKLCSTLQYFMCLFHALVLSLVFIFKHTRYLLLLSLYSLLPNSDLN